MTTIFFAIAAAASLSGAPVLAETATVAQSSAATAAPSKAKSEQRVCFVDTVTGSRIAKKACRTRAEWARQGVDLSQLNK